MHDFIQIVGLSISVSLAATAAATAISLPIGSALAIFRFPGRRLAVVLINALFGDPTLAEMSGQTVIGAELAARYGITDEGGRTPPSHREMLGAPRPPSTVVIR